MTTADTLTNTQALKALRLPSMSHSWQDVAAEATEHAWTHERFLGALCRLELAERSNRRLAAALRSARLPPGKRIDSFEFGLVPGLSRQRVEALCAGDAAPIWRCRSLTSRTRSGRRDADGQDGNRAGRKEEPRWCWG